MKTRIISATVAVVLLLAILFVSNWYTYVFNAMVSVLAAIATLEIFKVTKSTEHKPLLVAGLVWSVFMPFMGYADLRKYVGAIFFLYLIVFLAYMIFKHQKISLNNIGLLFFLNTLIPIGFSMLVFLRDFGATKRDGLFLMFTAFLCCWLADSGAYFTGRLLGKHKLAPAISPNKTIEGFVGGVVGAKAIDIVGDALREDDVEILGRLFNAVVSCMIGEYLLDATEMDKLMKKLDEVPSKEFKPLFGKILKSEQQEDTIREFLLPHFDAVVSEREPFALPSGEDIIEAIVEDCEESD